MTPEKEILSSAGLDAVVRPLGDSSRPLNGTRDEGGTRCTLEAIFQIRAHTQTLPPRSPPLCAAQVMTWSLKIGISLFLPMAVVGCAIREFGGGAGGARPGSLWGLGRRKPARCSLSSSALTRRTHPSARTPCCRAVIPIHYQAYQDSIAQQPDHHGKQQVQLIRLTVSSLPNGSPYFW
jgi:hypothetical protein